MTSTYRKVDEKEWIENGGEQNPLCSWLEGVGFVIEGVGSSICNKPAEEEFYDEKSNVNRQVFMP